MRFIRQVLTFTIIFSLTCSLPLSVFSQEQKAPKESQERKTPKNAEVTPTPTLLVDPPNENPEVSGSSGETTETQTPEPTNIEAMSGSTSDSPTLSNDPSATNENTGANSENEATAKKERKIAISQRNTTTIVDEITVESNTGGNEANYNTGNAGISTGNANATLSLTDQANFNIVEAGRSADTQNGPTSNNTAAENSNTGYDSQNTATSETSEEETIENENILNLERDLDITAETGDNSTSFNTGHGTSKTGNVNVVLDLFTFANTNAVEGSIEFEEYNVMDDQSEDIVFSFNASDALDTADTFSTVSASNENTGAQSENTAESSDYNFLEIINTNEADVVNEAKINASTGGNSSNYNTGNAKVETGNINIAANIINFVNTNLVGAKNFLIGVVNIFGNFEGDIVVPDFEGFNSADVSADSVSSADSSASSVNASTGASSENTAISTITSETTIENSNNLEVENNLAINAKTGDNKTDFNTGNAKVETGSVEVKTNEQTIGNLNSDENLFLIFINDLTGGLLGMTNLFAIGEPAFGGSLLSDAENSNTGYGSENTATSEVTEETKIENSNNALIVNNLAINASTGDNTASYNTGSGSVKTGDVNIAANIFNFANLNLSGKSVFMGIVNVFGDWLGRLVAHSEKEAETLGDSQTQTLGEENEEDEHEQNDEHEETSSQSNAGANVGGPQVEEKSENEGEGNNSENSVPPADSDTSTVTMEVSEVKVEEKTVVEMEVEKDGSSAEVSIEQDLLTESYQKIRKVLSQQTGSEEKEPKPEQPSPKVIRTSTFAAETAPSTSFVPEWRWVLVLIGFLPVSNLVRKKLV